MDMESKASCARLLSKIDTDTSNTLSLLLPVLSLMPDELFTANPPVEIIFTKGDGPMGMVHYELQERAETLGRAGKGESR